MSKITGTGVAKYIEEELARAKAYNNTLKTVANETFEYDDQDNLIRVEARIKLGCGGHVKVVVVEYTWDPQGRKTSETTTTWTE